MVAIAAAREALRRRRRNRFRFDGRPVGVRLLGVGHHGVLGVDRDILRLGLGVVSFDVVDILLVGDLLVGDLCALRLPRRILFRCRRVRRITVIGLRRRLGVGGRERRAWATQHHRGAHPSATAKPPTRPMYAEASIALPLKMHPRRHLRFPRRSGRWLFEDSGKTLHIANFARNSSFADQARHDFRRYRRCSYRR